MRAYDFVGRLTTAESTSSERTILLGQFADMLGWRPSDHLDLPELANTASAHLVVEHGLENSAVISFLQHPRRFNELDFTERLHLIEVSYNNLVDWHVAVERDAVSVIFNRTDPVRIVQHAAFSAVDTDSLRSEWFEEVSGRRPNPNIPALDDALIGTISFWKRALAAEIGGNVSNTSLSNLFNAIIFVRAIEDGTRRRGSNAPPALPQILLSLARDGVSVRRTVEEALSVLTQQQSIPAAVELDGLSAFDTLNPSTIRALFSDFYRNKFAPYRYDFSVISKHALSRIYEHYVSILRISTSEQQSIFPQLPKEELEKRFGSVYTPQYIARFFGRYLQQLAAKPLRDLRVLDPACGSGIFLRTLLELECDVEPLPTAVEVRAAIENLNGVDIDRNAVNATMLSLSLLFLVLTGEFPILLRVSQRDALAERDEDAVEGLFDVVIANPPFVATSAQGSELKQRILEILGELAVGRPDTYLAFLKIALDNLQQGGIGLFILPHTFLIAESAARVREHLAEVAWIRCIADLSAIRVFGDIGIYVVLLVFQKKRPTDMAFPALAVQCQDLVGRALQDTLAGRLQESNTYSIFEMQQNSFTAAPWLLLPPTESSIAERLRSLPTLERFANAHLGLISGADSVFIVDRGEVPDEERDLYAELLADREMRAYSTPATTKAVVFYPSATLLDLSEEQLQRYPWTWQRLLANRGRLESRSAVKKGQILWWQLERPRDPLTLLQPKIVTPHLVVVPRFGVDVGGRFAVSRSPFIVAKVAGAEVDLLKYLVAILNSSICYWYISNHSHKYQNGYAMLEPKTLRRTPIPDPASVAGVTRLKLLEMVEQRISGNSADARELDTEIDGLVSELYGISDRERRAIGLH